MTDVASIVWHGVEVTYSESDNRWEFAIGGRDRSAETLANAKKAIDAPEAKANTFKRVDAILWKYFASPEKRTLTGEAERSRFNKGRQFWSVDAKKKREMVDHGDLYADTAANHELIAEYGRVQAEIDSLGSRQIEIRYNMTPLKLEDEKEK